MLVLPLWLNRILLIGYGKPAFSGARNRKIKQLFLNACGKLM